MNSPKIMKNNSNGISQKKYSMNSTMLPERQGKDEYLSD